MQNVEEILKSSSWLLNGKAKPSVTGKRDFTLYPRGKIIA